MDGQGDVHIAVAGDTGIWYLTNRSGTWTRKRLTTVVGHDREPSIALDDDGSLSVAFTRYGPCDDCTPNPSTGIYLVSDRSGSWSKPERIADPESHSPSLKLRDGHVYLAYAFGEVPRDDGYPVLYTTDRSGKWSTATVSDDGSRPSLRLGADGAARVAFETYESDRLWYAVEDPTKGSFHAEPIGETPGFDVSLALDGSDRPAVAWARWTDERQDRMDVAYSTLRDGAWSDPQLLLPDADGAPSVAIDGHDGVHLTAGGTTGVWYTTNRNGAFETKRLTTREGIAATIRIDTADRAHVVFVTEGSSHGVWYARGPGN